MNPHRSKNFSIVLWLYCVLMGVSFSFGQKQVSPKNLTEAQNNKKQLTEQIKSLNELYNGTKTDKKITMLHVQTLIIKISAREALINNINYEIKQINGLISKKQKEIDKKNAELDTLKAHYKKMVYYAFRNKEAYNKLMFVFASDNFNQAYERVKYMQEITEKRVEHSKTIVKKQEELGAEQKQLQNQIAEKRNLLNSEEQEKITLAKEKGEQEDVLGQLSSKEKQIKEELDQKKKFARELDNKIKEMTEEIIAKMEKERKEREAEKQRKKDEIARNKNKNPKNKDKKNKVETADSKIPESDRDFNIDLSEDFASNKGKLPWPLTKGVITEGFGPHEHPKIKDFIINNPGVDITVQNKTGVARAIFDGEVTGIAPMPDGNGKFVIIRHGTYLSVYTNLNTVYVKTGDKVKVKQNIGEIDFNEDKGGTTMNLQIWKGTNKLNPEDWLYKGG